MKLPSSWRRSGGIPKKCTVLSISDFGVFHRYLVCDHPIDFVREKYLQKQAHGNYDISIVAFYRKFQLQSGCVPEAGMRPTGRDLEERFPASPLWPDPDG